MNEKYFYTDFDKTLTLKDTYTISIFHFANIFRIVFYLPIIMFFGMFYIFGVYSRNQMKVLTFKLLFKNLNLTEINRKMGSFINKIKFNEDALDIIKKYQSEGYKIILVSASIDYYIKPICEKLNYDGYISTVSDVEQGKLTGVLKGENCNFYEKVLKIKQSKYYDENAKIVAMGNSKGDFDMLKMAETYYFVSSTKILTNPDLS